MINGSTVAIKKMNIMKNDDGYKFDRLDFSKKIIHL